VGNIERERVERSSWVEGEGGFGRMNWGGTNPGYSPL